jgi:hypothetical protein
LGPDKLRRPQGPGQRVSFGPAELRLAVGLNRLPEGYRVTMVIERQDTVLMSDRTTGVMLDPVDASGDGPQIAIC